MRKRRKTSRRKNVRRKPRRKNVRRKPRKRNRTRRLNTNKRRARRKNTSIKRRRRRNTTAVARRRNRLTVRRTNRTVRRRRKKNPTILDTIQEAGGQIVKQGFSGCLGYVANGYIGTYVEKAMKKNPWGHAVGTGVGLVASSIAYGSLKNKGTTVRKYMPSFIIGAGLQFVLSVVQAIDPPKPGKKDGWLMGGLKASMGLHTVSSAKAKPELTK